MGLILYRCHNEACGKSRRLRRCSCPIWVQGSLAGDTIRKALNLTSWEAAQNLIHAWKEAGKIGAEFEKKVEVKEAVQKFLADARARELRSGTVELYEQTLLRQFAPWCETQQISDAAAQGGNAPHLSRDVEVQNRDGRPEN